VLPKRGRRSITVNDVLYHYIVSGSVSVVIRNSVTGALIKWNREWKEKWKMQLRPSDIEQIIKDSK
jgi:hypothetical protein